MKTGPVPTQTPACGAGTPIRHVDVVLLVSDTTGRECAVAVFRAIDRPGLERDCHCVVAALPAVVAVDVFDIDATAHAASSELAQFASRFVSSHLGPSFRWVGGPEPGVVEFADRNWCRSDATHLTGRVAVAVSEELSF